MSEIRDIGYDVVVPGQVLVAGDISASEKLMYAEVRALANRWGYCNASNAHLAKTFRKKIKTVSDQVSKLVECGYLDREVIRDEVTNQVIERRLYIVELSQRDISKCDNNDADTPLPKKTDTSPEKNADPLPKKTDLYIGREIINKEREGNTHAQEGNKAQKSKPAKMQYGILQNVLLTEAEHERLVDKYGKQTVDDMIEELSCAMPNLKREPRNHNAALHQWIRRAQKEQAERVTLRPEPRKQARGEEEW